MIFHTITTLFLLSSTLATPLPDLPNETGHAIETIISNFNPKTFMTDIQTFSRKGQFNAIKKAILSGHLNELIGKSQFIESIRRWPNVLKTTAINDAIRQGNTEALALILNSGVDPDLSRYIVDSQLSNHLDMVVMMALHGDFKALEQAFLVLTIHINGANYLEQLLQQSKGKQYVDIFFMKYFELAAFNGDLESVEIFLRNMETADGMIVRSQLSTFSKHLNNDELRNLLIMEVILQASIKGKALRVSMLLLDNMIEIMEKNDIYTMRQIIKTFKAQTNAVLLEYAGIKENKLIFRALSKSKIQLNLKDEIHILAVKGKWDFLLDLSLDFPGLIQLEIMKTVDGEKRLQLFRSFLEKIKSSNLAEIIRFKSFRAVASAGDINFLKLFWDNQKLQNSKLIYGIQEMKSFKKIYKLLNPPPDASNWMLIHGILGAWEHRKMEAVNFLLGMIDPMSKDNILLYNIAQVIGDVDLQNFMKTTGRIHNIQSD